MLIISPHLDDAVFSCGQLLACHPGTAVVTVLAGVPSAEQPLTEWDRETGFATSRESVVARRREDARACAVLAATAIRLDLLDGQYEQPVDRDEVLRAELTRVMARLSAHVLYVPLGIRHPDHQLVGGAAREIAVLLDLPVVVYEELPYRVEEPEEHQAARARLVDEGWLLEPREEAQGPVALKSAAIDRYASQERQFSRRHLLAAEQYFTAARSPHRYR